MKINPSVGGSLISGAASLLGGLLVRLLLIRLLKHDYKLSVKLTL